MTQQCAHIGDGIESEILGANSQRIKCTKYKPKMVCLRSRSTLPLYGNHELFTHSVKASAIRRAITSDVGGAGVAILMESCNHDSGATV